MARVSIRKLAVLALLAAQDDKGKPAQPIVGITRLQKLLFLTWVRLPKTSANREIDVDFAFSPERYGPADVRLYPDLDFLVTLGHVARSHSGSLEQFLGAGAALATEEATEAALTFSYLMDSERDGADLAAAENAEEAFAITPLGLRLLRHLVSDVQKKDRALAESVIGAANEVRSKYGAWPLARLLKYVYSEYPEMTTASEIRERVLGS
jgi:hypothetical protein